ncbi:MAG: cyclase family protein [Bacteroidia bacterium]|nr:cyclase family protein [Bacteroidia bacterium]
MRIQLTHAGENYEADLNQPLDISIPLGQVKCFFADDFKISPVMAIDFVGSVKMGSPVNFFDVEMNPHGNGTHTECLGHITLKHQSLNDQLKQFHFFANVLSISLEEKEGGDRVITKEKLQAALPERIEEAIIIRTLPNSEEKLNKNYSGKNPPYLHHEAMKFLVENKVKHLLIDLPSVDRESDEGKLLSHHVFWKVFHREALDDSRADCTITELIYVPDEIEDGLYLLNLQFPSMPLDAAPSKPVLYKLNKKS